MNCNICGKEIVCSFSIEDGILYCLECKEKRLEEESNRVKFYTFENFEYNALIMATDEDMALEGYYIEVSECREDAKPTEIDTKDAIIWYMRSCDKDVRILLQEFFDITQKFKEGLNKGCLQYEVLLLDSCMC